MRLHNDEQAVLHRYHMIREYGLITECGLYQREMIGASQFTEHKPWLPRLIIGWVTTWVKDFCCIRKALGISTFPFLYGHPKPTNGVMLEQWSIISPDWLSERGGKKRTDFAIYHFYAWFVGQWNPEMTSQSKLNPFSNIVVHGSKKSPTSLFWKSATSEGKIQGQNRARVNRAVEKVYLSEKKFWR